MVDEIISDSRYLHELDIIKEIEKDRIFCKHDYNHCKEVSEILTILSKRRGLDNFEELSVLMSYFHDIGRAFRYDDSHDKCSSDFVRLLLEEYEYQEEDVELICYAINNHSGRMSENKIYDYIDNNLVEDSIGDTWAMLLRIADQLSRNCYSCKAREMCKWHEGEKISENWKQRI